MALAPQGSRPTHRIRSLKEPECRERLPEARQTQVGCAKACVSACARARKARGSRRPSHPLSPVLYFACLCSQNSKRARSALPSEGVGAVACWLARAELAAGLQTVSPCSPRVN